MWIVFILTLLLITNESFASCFKMVKPVDSNEYTGTSEDFKKGFSTLYRDRYIDTTQTYYEGIGSHPGVDITHDKNGQHFTTNTPVWAICEGAVERVTIDKKKDGGWGNSLTIRHETLGVGTVFSIYAHLDRFTRNFIKGDPISRGEQIGFVGTTGNSTGIHLHFQIDNTIPPKHPFFPNRGCSPACSVNTPDDDRLVADKTFSPLQFIADHQTPPLWSATLNDPQGDAPSGYDIIQASAQHDGSIFSVTIKLANSYATAPYSGFGVRINTNGALYVLGFCTSSGCWGPQLVVSYDGGKTWQFAPGSFGGNINANLIDLWVNMSDIGALPWTIDFVSGIVFSLTAYEIKDLTDSLSVVSTILLSDNFNDENAFGWEERSGNWTVENGQYSSYLNGCQMQGKTLIGSSGWTDYIYEIDVIRLEGVETELAFRVNQDGSKFYRVAFRTGWYYDFGQDYVFLFKNTGLLTVTNYTLQLNIWYRIKIEAIGNNIKIYIKRQGEANFNLLVNYTDNNSPNLSGRVGIFDWSGDACIVHNHYDNILVSE